MVSEPVYKGEFVANRLAYYLTGEYREDGKPKQRFRIRPENEWIRVPVPAIVSAEEWDQAQEALSRHHKRSIRNGRKHRWLLTGLLKCDYCGFSYVSASQRGY